MAKCPGKFEDGRKCSQELDERARFCQECGYKIDKSIFKKQTIKCHGKLDDGGECSEIIEKGQKFCKECGWKVDQSLFKTESKLCVNAECRKVLKDGAKFCEECGTKFVPQDRKENIADENAPGGRKGDRETEHPENRRDDTSVDDNTGDREKENLENRRDATSADGNSGDRGTEHPGTKGDDTSVNDNTGDRETEHREIIRDDTSLNGNTGDRGTEHPETKGDDTSVDDNTGDQDTEHQETKRDDMSKDGKTGEKSKQDSENLPAGKDGISKDSYAGDHDAAHLAKLPTRNEGSPVDGNPANDIDANVSVGEEQSESRRNNENDDSTSSGDESFYMAKEVSSGQTCKEEGEAKKQTISDQRQNISCRNSKQIKATDQIDVVFHAIASVECEVEGCTSIALRFKSEKEQNEMKIIKTIHDPDNKGLNLGKELEIKISINKDKLRRKLQYIYLRKFKSGWKEERDLHGRDVKRSVNIPFDLLERRDLWHVYDGYIYTGKFGQEGKNRISYLPKFLQNLIFKDEPLVIQKLIKDGISAVDTFFSPLLLPNTKRTAFVDALDRISSIKHGSLYIHFLNLDNSGWYYDIPFFDLRNCTKKNFISTCKKPYAEYVYICILGEHLRNEEFNLPHNEKLYETAKLNVILYGMRSVIHKEYF